MQDLGERTAVVVDHHPLWLDAVTPVVRKSGIDVVAQTTSGSEALARIADLTPDILVTGIDMADGEMDGIELVRRGIEAVPSLKAIVLSIHDDAVHIDAAVAAGAAAYVVKTAHPDDLVAAIRQAFAHSLHFAGGRAARSSISDVAARDVPHELTRREIEILRLVAEGHSNAALARQLWVTEQTVKFHLSNVYRKLQVSNRTEASRWAQVNGLLEEQQGASVPAVARLAVS